jgi:hypothetical protein
MWPISDEVRSVELRVRLAWFLRHVARTHHVANRRAIRANRSSNRARRRSTIGSAATEDTSNPSNPKPEPVGVSHQGDTPTAITL